VLTPLGKKLLDAEINARKALLNKQLRKLGTFRFVIQILSEARGKRLPKDVVEEELVMRLPTEDVEPLFKTVMAWGRFAELFRYDAQSETLSLEEPNKETENAAPKEAGRSKD
jgi:NitT/TauT family transport system ATP-binding protein